MNPAILQSSFVQTALPIMFTILVAAWMNSRSSDTVNRRFDDMSKLITAESARLEAVLKLEIGKLEMRVRGLEERAGLIFRG